MTTENQKNEDPHLRAAIERTKFDMVVGAWAALILGIANMFMLKEWGYAESVIQARIVVCVLAFWGLRAGHTWTLLLMEILKNLKELNIQTMHRPNGAENTTTYQMKGQNHDR